MTHREKLLAFLDTIRRPDRALDVDEREGLVRSGLIDSLALLEIITWLESEYGIDFAERGLTAADVTSIAGILEIIESRQS